MLTKKLFDQLYNHTVFATGIVRNGDAPCKDGLYILTDKQEKIDALLTWEAIKVKGFWTIRMSTKQIFDKHFNETLMTVENVRSLVPCDDEMFERYLWYEKRDAPYKDGNTLIPVEK